MYANKLKTSDEIEKFLEGYTLQALAQEKNRKWNSAIFIDEIKFIIKNFPQRKLQAQITSLSNSNKYLRSLNILTQTPQIMEEREHLPTHAIEQA